MLGAFIFYGRFGERYLIAADGDRSRFLLPEFLDFDAEPLPPSAAGLALAHFAPTAFGNEDLRRFWSQYDHSYFCDGLSRLSDHELYERLLREFDAPFGSLRIHPLQRRLEGRGAGATDADGGGAAGMSKAPAASTESSVSRKAALPPGRAPAAKPPAAAKPEWIADILKVMCPKDKAFLADLKARGVTLTAYDRIYFDDPYYDGKRWTTKRFEAGGTTDGTHINLIRSPSAEDNAATIYHEGIHTGQPESMAWRDREYDAYIKEDRWRISHGLLPHDPSFRTKDAAGRETTNEAAVKAMVDSQYPGVTTKSPAGKPEQVVGKTKSGKTVVQRDDGSTYTRPPKKGDSFAGKQVTVPAGGIPVDTAELQCP